MAKITPAKYRQKGETIVYRNTTREAIPAGSIVTVGKIIGVTTAEIKPDDTATLYIEGIFQFPKKAGEKIDLGEVVCLKDGEIQKHQEGDHPAGVAVSTAADTDATVLVKINIT